MIGSSWGSRRWTAITVTLIVTGGAGFLGYSQTARAEPAPSVAQVQAEVNSLLIRLPLPADAATAVAAIATTLRRELPAAVVDYSFVEDTYAARFAAEQRIGPHVVTVDGSAALPCMFPIVGMFRLLRWRSYSPH